MQPCSAIVWIWWSRCVFQAAEQTGFWYGGTTTCALGCQFKTAWETGSPSKAPSPMRVSKEVLIWSRRSGTPVGVGPPLLARWVHTPERYDFHRLQDALYARCAGQEHLESGSAILNIDRQGRESIALTGCSWPIEVIRCQDWFWIIFKIATSNLICCN